MDNVHQLGITTPFDIGRVNCYIIDMDGLTLLDPGPATEEAYSDLTTGLKNHGFTVADVDRVLITHPHSDHFGLVSRVVTESDARTVAHRDAVRCLVDPSDHFERKLPFLRSLLRVMGAPEQDVRRAISHPDSYTDYQEALEVDRELVDGDRIDVGVDLQAVHTPGHSPGSVCYLSATDPVAFTGDHVIRHISPNPLLTLAPGTNDERTRSLPSYLESLHRILEFDVHVGYPGHGEIIPDLYCRVDEILAHHQRRKERIANILEERGPTTAYDITQKMFPDLPATQLFPGMSEVIGHLDLLEDETRVHITEEVGVYQYTLCED